MPGVRAGVGKYSAERWEKQTAGRKAVERRTSGSARKRQPAVTPQNARSCATHPWILLSNFSPLLGLPVGSTAGVYAGGSGWRRGWRAGWPSRWRGGWRGLARGDFSRGRELAGAGGWAGKMAEEGRFQDSEARVAGADRSAEKRRRGQISEGRRQRLAIGYRQLAIGYRQLAIGD